ncbi:MAG: hypothetical protein U9R74_18870 [Pseudomonadota bacterium]|nr:hypothetical protein [Pseudomonadota bacterium]
MRYPTDDVELAEALGLSYQQIATALGVTRQAVRNAVVKKTGYLTIDRLLQVYDHLPEGAHKENVADAIRQRLPWQKEASQQPVDWQRALSTQWSTVWLVAPSTALVESTARWVARAASGRKDAAVAVLLPKVKDTDVRRLVRLFPNAQARPGETALRFAVAEFPHAGLFPALVLVDPSRRSAAGYLITGEGLVPVPEEQIDAMVPGGLYMIDPWRDNEIWGIRNVYAAMQREVVLDLPAAAASGEPSDKGFSVRFADQASVYGAVSVSFDDTRTGWWMTVEGEDLHPGIKTVALEGRYRGENMAVFRLDPDDLPVRSPWPLADILPAELLRAREVRLTMEVV